mmetsp:Transcript_6623/g.24750  ORF Transcript_6623/g.24750 Transcript_6623/m.24750 type:complete len:616 (-) Transcript_6623:278-2125(-)
MKSTNRKKRKKVHSTRQDQRHEGNDDTHHLEHSQHAEFAKLDIKQMNNNLRKKKLIEEKYATRSGDDVEESFMEQRPRTRKAAKSRSSRQHHQHTHQHNANTTTATSSQLKSLEKAYESIQEEIEEFERSRVDVFDEEGLEVEAEIQREEYEEGHTGSSRQISAEQLESTVTNEALQEWRNFKKQQQAAHKSLDTQTHHVMADNFMMRDELAERIVSAKASHLPATSQHQTEWEEIVRELNSKVANQNSQNEQLRFEFEQYRRLSENQIGDLTRELHEMRNLLQTELGKTNQKQNGSIRRTATFSQASDGPQTTLVDESTPQTDDEDDDECMYEDEGEEYGEENLSHQPQDSEEEEEALPHVASRNLHAAGEHLHRALSAPRRTVSVPQSSLNDSTEHLKPPRKQSQETKIVRSAVPNPSFSFNVLGRASKRSGAGMSTNPAPPQTPQPNREIPVPSQNAESMKMHNELQEETAPMHNAQTQPQNPVVPPINRTSERIARPSDPSILSPERQQKPMHKRSSSQCPALSPRPSINRSSTGNANSTRRQSAGPTSQQHQNGFPSLGLADLNDSEEDTFQPMPVTIFGRDRSNLEPKISSNSGRFEIRKFIPKTSNRS